MPDTNPTEVSINPSKNQLSFKLLAILKSNLYLIFATLIALFSGFFFLSINDFKYLTIVSLSQRSVGILMLGIIFLLTFLACYYSNRNPLQKVSIWVQSNLLTFFSFAYFIGINAVNISFLGLTLNTGLAGVLLTIIIFFVNLNLFGKNQKNLALLVPQIIIFGLQTYSFINLLQADKTALRAFSTDWITLIFNINNLVWLVFCALAISIVSVLSYNMSSFKQNLLFIVIFAVLNLQVLYAINNIANLSYWYKALIFLIYWDFLYNPLYTIVSGMEDKSFQPKLIISTVYHLILFTLVLLGKPIFG